MDLQIELVGRLLSLDWPLLHVEEVLKLRVQPALLLEGQVGPVEEPAQDVPFQEVIDAPAKLHVLGEVVVANVQQVDCLLCELELAGGFLSLIEEVFHQALEVCIFDQKELDVRFQLLEVFVCLRLLPASCGCLLVDGLGAQLCHCGPAFGKILGQLGHLCHEFTNLLLAGLATESVDLGLQLLLFSAFLSRLPHEEFYLLVLEL